MALDVVFQHYVQDETFGFEGAFVPSVFVIAAAGAFDPSVFVIAAAGAFDPSVFAVDWEGTLVWMAVDHEKDIQVSYPVVVPWVRQYVPEVGLGWVGSSNGFFRFCRCRDMPSSEGQSGKEGIVGKTPWVADF